MVKVLQHFIHGNVPKTHFQIQSGKNILLQPGFLQVPVFGEVDRSFHGSGIELIKVNAKVHTSVFLAH